MFIGELKKKCPVNIFKTNKLSAMQKFKKIEAKKTVKIAQIVKFVVIANFCIWDKVATLFELL